MSKASELIAEAKHELAEAETALKAYEKTAETEIESFIELAHLKKVLVHAREASRLITNRVPEDEAPEQSIESGVAPKSRATPNSRRKS